LSMDKLNCIEATEQFSQWAEEMERSVKPFWSCFSAGMWVLNIAIAFVVVGCWLGCITGIGVFLALWLAGRIGCCVIGGVFEYRHFKPLFDEYNRIVAEEYRTNAKSNTWNRVWRMRLQQPTIETGAFLLVFLVAASV
jgi:hypothetical protein